jgi:hypothetical protein
MEAHLALELLAKIDQDAHLQILELLKDGPSDPVSIRTLQVAIILHAKLTSESADKLSIPFLKLYAKVSLKIECLDELKTEMGGDTNDWIHVAQLYAQELYRLERFSELTGKVYPEILKRLQADGC